MYSTLQSVVTPEIEVLISKENGVTFNDGTTLFDADDELIEIARYIKMNAVHNGEIEPERIKYLYTTTAKKDGGKYVLGVLEARSLKEKRVNNDFDYILTVYYKGWKELDIENKVIQLDKLLCGVKVTTDNKIKKRSIDSKEYINNLRHYGADKVLKSTEILDMAIDRIINEEKEEKKNG